MREELLLSRVGLSKREAAIYIALLRSGPTSIRQIAALTKINRGSTYEAIKKLVGMGLVSFKVSGSRSKYSAESPEKINQLIVERQSELSSLMEEAGRTLPSLKAFAQSSAEAPKVRFYEDDEGIANILKDVLETVSKAEKKEYYVYSSRSLRQYIYRQFPNFTKRRIKEKIFVKVIAVGTGGATDDLSQRKLLPDSSDEISSSYNIIYGNKVALISVSKDLTPYGVVIEEDGVAAMQRLLFNNLWRSL